MPPSMEPAVEKCEGCNEAGHVLHDGRCGYCEGLRCRVHDELIFECAPEAVAEVCALIKAEMEGVYVLKAPLKVDVGVGDSWFDAK